MRQNLTSHIVIDVFLKFNQFCILGFLIVNDITLVVTLDFSLLIHDRETICDLFQQLLVSGRCGQSLSQNRHECRRRIIDLIGYRSVQCCDDSFVNRKVILIGFQFLDILASRFFQTFQFVNFCLVIQRGQRTLRQHCRYALSGD